LQFQFKGIGTYRETTYNPEIGERFEFVQAEIKIGHFEKTENKILKAI
jgi:hypothetical protein